MQPDQIERLDAFAAAAEAYCRWAEGDARDPVQDAAMARVLTAELFRRAIDLPHIFESDIDAPDIGADDYQRIYRRLGSLPFNYYSECFNPLAVPAEAAAAMYALQSWFSLNTDTID